MSATLTKDQQDAARKAERAKKEKARREEIKAAKETLERGGLDVDMKLDAEQRRRAATAPKTLEGPALAKYITQGPPKPEDELAQLNARVSERGYSSAEADRARKLAKQAGVDVPTWARTGSNGSGGGGERRPKDPEAADLAAAAAKRAPDVKSAFLPKDARCFLDEVLDGKRADSLLLNALPPKEDGESPRDLDVAQLAAFAEKGEKDPEVRTFLKNLGSGTRLWGRKLGLMLLEQLERESK